MSLNKGSAAGINVVVLKSQAYLFLRVKNRLNGGFFEYNHILKRSGNMWNEKSKVSQRRKVLLFECILWLPLFRGSASSGVCHGFIIVACPPAMPALSA